jgi:Mg2+/citrate symporter
MRLRERLEAAKNGLLPAAYLWIGVLTIIAPQSSKAIQALDQTGQNIISVSSLFFAAICFVGLLTRAGVLRANNFTRGETIFPLVCVFALALYTFPSA